MKIEISDDHGVAVVRLEGRLDGFGAQEAGKVLAALAGGSRVVFDFAGVSYLSSAGVRLLLSSHKAALASGGAVVLASLQPFCASVLDMSGLAGMIPAFS